MAIYHVDKPDVMIQKIVKATFPGYRGRKFKLSTDIPSRLDSYWDGGSKDSFAFYELSTGTLFSVASNHPYFQRQNPRNLEEMPPGVILVKHSVFRGKDMGITIYATPEQLAPLLPPQQEISENEKIVLTYTRGLKPCYAGISNYRFHAAHREKGISQTAWEEAKKSLIGKKLLNRAGAITAAGRNAIN